jgi:hypothetical protein
MGGGADDDGIRCCETVTIFGIREWVRLLGANGHLVMYGNHV